MFRCFLVLDLIFQAGWDTGHGLILIVPIVIPI